MGMPSVTCYSFLKTLSYNSEWYQTQRVEEILRHFNLFAFIVYDPKTHDVFDTHLKQSFDLYDHITGDKLLFFAPIDPPDEWLAHANNRNYYDTIKVISNTINTILSPVMQH